MYFFLPRAVWSKYLVYQLLSSNYYYYYVRYFHVGLAILFNSTILNGHKIFITIVVLINRIWRRQPIGRSCAVYV